jgi:hypothetical protein
MDSLTEYCLRQASAWSGRGEHIAEAIGPIYTVAPFLQQGHEIGFWEVYYELLNP